MSVSVLLVANDHVGTRMAGPGIRYWNFARELAKTFDVTLTVPYETDLVAETFDIRVVHPHHRREILALAAKADAVVSERLAVPIMQELARRSIRTVYDLYTPVTLEVLATAEQERAVELLHRLFALDQQVALSTGTAFICASERQRDLWLGALLAGGRIDAATHARDPSLRQLIDVVPFGIRSEQPKRAQPVLRGVVPGIDVGDLILLWNGGIWNWLDPLTVIRAVDRLRSKYGNLRLFFLGTERPNPQVARMSMADGAGALARELGLLGTHVFFNEDWVPYEQLADYLLEADVAVAAHFDNVETRFAFRTRLLDCVWAGLPIVTSRGDVVADVVDEFGLGRTAAVGDVDGYAAALDELLANGSARAELAPAFEIARRELEWSRVIEPLARLVGGGPPAKATPGFAPLSRWAVTRFEYAIRNRGAAGALRRLTKLASSRVRPR